MEPARRARSRTSFKERVRRWFTWPKIRRALKWSAIGGLVLTALVAVAVAITFWVYARDPRLPSVSALRNYEPKQVTRIVVPGPSGKPQLLGEIYTQRRSFVAYEDIPPMLVDAFIVAEDAGYRDHGGIDYRGMIRAFFVNLFSGEAKQGASTITQQVVKNLLLTPEKTFRRKMQEIILARRLESALSKDEILELYLNQIYFGQGRYGIVEASRYYFGKELKELDVGQMAYLAGLPQAPETISKNKERGADRRAYVLNQLLRYGKIDEATVKKFIDSATPDGGAPPSPVAPEVVDLVRAELLAEHGQAKLDTLGAEVRVSIRPDLQKSARAALQARLRKFDEKHKVGVAIRKVAPDKLDAEIAKLKKKVPGSGPKGGEVYPALVTAVHDADQELEVDLGGWTAAVPLAGDDTFRFNPDGKKPSERFAKGDVVEVIVPKGLGEAATATKHGGGKMVRLAPGPEGAVVVIDVKTRKVLALVGGFDGRPGAFNRAVQAKRQPGSTFKPFVYAAAIAAGRYTAASIVNDAPDVFDLWKPKNYGKCCEGPVRLRYALAKSINTVAIRVCHDIGPTAVAALAHAMGIESDLPEHLSLSLGSGEVTPLELTNAFATFAAGGKHMPPRIIDAVDGKLTPAPEPTQALSPEISYIVVDMMMSVMQPGGSAADAAKGLKLTTAGKTGTSNDERDAWFVGLTPDYAIGVWVGYDDNRPLGSKQTGGVVSAPIFVEVLKATGAKQKSFERPAGIAQVRIDKATGLLAPESAPESSSYDEVFIAGTTPTEVAPLPGEVDTNTYIEGEYDDEETDETDETEPEDAQPRATP
jgi:penicillin-binding protein 1A